MRTRTRPRSGYALLGPATVSVVLMLSACGGDATADSGNGDVAAESAGRRGAPAGTLVLGDTTYELRVTQCDLDGDFDTAAGDGTFSGSGQLDDGTRFTVTVGREQVMAPYLRHEVWAGALSALDRFDWTAERENTAQGWRGEALDGPAPDEPLVRIDGKTVTAEGGFIDTRPGAIPDSEGRDPVQGRLEVTCP